MVREQTPSTQSVGGAELHDPHIEEEGEEEKATKPTESTLERAVEDFTISEPVQEKDDQGEGVKEETAEDAVGDPDKDEKETIEH